MKQRIRGLLLICTIFVVLTGWCVQAIAQSDEYVTDQVLEALDNLWADTKYEIKHTRVVTIKDNDTKIFQDVHYVVQFKIFSDYFHTDPLLLDIAMRDNIMVMKDGTIGRITTNDPFRLHIQMTYDTDLSGIVDEIIDLGTAYNKEAD